MGMPMLPRRHFLIAACALLAACASMLGPRDVALPLSKLQAAVDKRFPVNRRVLELLDIELSGPRLGIEPGTDRVTLNLDAVLSPPFTRQSWQGRLALSGRLAIDPARTGLYMENPRVERFELDGLDPQRQRQLGKVAGLLID